MHGWLCTAVATNAGYRDEWVRNLKDSFGPLPAGEDVADAIHCIASRPRHVHIGNLVLRPTRRDYP